MRPSEASCNATTLVRNLGLFEDFFYMMNRQQPMHFAMAAQLRGTASEDVWQAAFLSLQQRHPLLRVRIDSDDEARRGFYENTHAALPLTIRVRTSADQWKVEYSQQMALPINSDVAPLWRAVILRGEKQTDIIVACHHSIADGMSIASLFRDLLKEVSGLHGEAMAVSPALEKLLADRLTQPKTQPDPPEAAAGPPACYLDHLVEGPQIDTAWLSAEETQALRQATRRNQTTIHGALCAAIVLAAQQISPAWRSNPVRIFSPINYRPRLGLAEDILLAIGNAQSTLTPIQDADFWDVARAARASLEPKLEPSGMLAFADLVAGLLKAFPVSTDLAEVFSKGFAFEVMVSNLGDLSFPQSIGDIAIESMWGPSFLARFRHEQSIGVITVRGRLHLLHLSYDPIAALLSRTKELLVSCCR